MVASRKGSNSERELLRMFIDSGWAAIRIAGSGKMENAPDIIAGHPGKLLIIECKSSGKPALYIDNQEILNTIEYANKFGGEPWYAFRFDRTEWHFVPALSLLGNNKVTPETGIKFDMLILKDRKTI